MFWNNLGNEPGRLSQTPEAPAYCSKQLCSAHQLQAGQRPAWLTSYLSTNAFENVSLVAVPVESLQYALAVAFVTKQVEIELSKYMGSLRISTASHMGLFSFVCWTALSVLCQKNPTCNDQILLPLFTVRVGFL